MITRLLAVPLVAAVAVAYIAATTPRQEEVPERNIPDVVIPAIPPTPTFSPPSVDGTTWESLVKTSSMTVDLDGTSVKVFAVDDAWRVQSRLRISFLNEIDVKGQTKKGAYYINTMSANCNKNNLTIDASTVYSKDGEALATGENLGVLENPKNPESFITLWIAVVCKDLRGRKVPVSI